MCFWVGSRSIILASRYRITLKHIHYFVEIMLDKIIINCIFETIFDFQYIFYESVLLTI